MNFSLSMKARLSIIFALTTILLIIIFGIVYGHRSVMQVESEIGNSLSETANMLENNLGQYMWSRYGETNLLSTLPEIRQPEDDEQTEILLNQLQTAIPSFSWIGLTDEDGTVIASTNSILKGVDISARPVYAEALEETFIGDVHEAVLLADLLPNPSGEDMKFVDISTPIYNYDNQFIGVLATHLSWEWMKEIEAAMLETLKNRERIEFLIVSKRDNTVILGPDEMLGQQLDLMSIDLAETYKNGWTMETWPNGKKYATGYMLEDGFKEYPGLEWVILVRQPAQIAYAPVKELLMYFIATGFVFVLLFAVLGWFLAGKIAYPLKKLACAADDLRHGKAVQIPLYKGISELETLSDSLRKLVSNLTKTESALEEMEEAANRDGLTGLANRYALDLYLNDFTENHRNATVLYIDLDGFKQINDTLGHSAGDELLVQVAARLKMVIRGEEMICRVGGDEFVVVLSSGSCEAGIKVAEKIISSINEPYWLDDQSSSISCSIGVAFWDASGSVSIGDTIGVADEALYIAKNAGKNQYYIDGSIKS